MAGTTRNKKNKQSLPQKTGSAQRGIWMNAAGVLALFVLFFPFDSSLKDPFFAVRFTSLAALLLAGSIYILTRKSVFSFGYKQPLTKLFFSISLAFFLWSIICSFQAINPYESMFYLARWVLLMLAIIIWIEWGRTWSLDWVYPTLSVILLVQALVGIMQFYGLNILDIPSNAPPSGFSGNRNLYGSLLVMMMPFAVVQTLRGKGTWAFIGVLAMGAGIFALILSQTRSAWLGFLAAGALFMVIMWRYRKQLPLEVLRRIGQVGIGGGIAFILFFFILIKTDKAGNFSQRLIERVKSLYNFDDTDQASEAVRNMEERIYVWGKTVDMIKDHPLTGVGPGNWRVNFPLYGSPPQLPGVNDEIDRQMVRPHHMYLHIAGETGLPGILLFYAVGLVLFIAGFRLFSPTKYPGALLPASLLLSGLLALALDMSFSFPLERMEHAVLLTLICGIVFSTLEGKGAPGPRKWYYALAIPFLVFCLILGKEKWKFDYYIQKSIDYEFRGNHEATVESALSGMSKWIKLDPVCDPMELHTARGYLKMNQFDKAEEELDKALKYSPYLHRIHNTIAVSQIRQEQYQEAISTLKKSLLYCPGYNPSMINLAYSYYRVDSFESSKQLLEKIDLSRDTNLLLLYADIEKRLEMINAQKQNNGGK